jgi:hypothetical protein
MTQTYAPLALALCALLTACGSGESPPEPDKPALLNSTNMVEAIAIAQRAQDSVLVVNQLFRLASIELLTDLPAKTAGPCSGGGDFSYTGTGQQHSLQLRQCQLKDYRYRKGTLGYVEAQDGTTLTLTDVGFDMPLLSLSFDVVGTVVESQIAMQPKRVAGDVKISAGAISDSWKYTLTSQPAASGDLVVGEMTLQTSRLPFSMVMQWTVEKPGATLRAPDGSSVTVISYDGTRGVAELGVPGRPPARQEFTSTDLQAMLKRWTY